MFHQPLIVLIIGISFCSIQCSTGSPICPINEKFAQCERVNPATCKNKQGSDDWTCSSAGRCVCAHDWLVRNDKGVCIPVWRCPDICPPRMVFRGCRFSHELSDGNGITAKKYFQLCKPRCIPRMFIGMKG